MSPLCPEAIKHGAKIRRLERGRIRRLVQLERQRIDRELSEAGASKYLRDAVRDGMDRLYDIVKKTGG